MVEAFQESAAAVVVQVEPYQSCYEIVSIVEFRHYVYASLDHRKLHEVLAVAEELHELPLVADERQRLFAAIRLAVEQYAQLVDQDHLVVAASEAVEYACS